MKIKLWQTVWLVISVAGCATQPRTQISETSNDFPTHARVEYVFECMQKHGGQNYDNLYHCSCALDELAKNLSYQEYSEAVAFTKLRSLPGEAGGVFRDPPKANELRAKLKAGEEAAEAACFVK